MVDESVPFIILFPSYLSLSSSVPFFQVPNPPPRSPFLSGSVLALALPFIKTKGKKKITNEVRNSGAA